MRAYRIRESGHIDLICRGRPGRHTDGIRWRTVPGLKRHSTDSPCNVGCSLRSGFQRGGNYRPCSAHGL